MFLIYILIVFCCKNFFEPLLSEKKRQKSEKNYENAYSLHLYISISKIELYLDFLVGYPPDLCKT